MIRLYHGSDQEISEIDLTRGQHFFATERAVSLLKKVEVINL